MSQNNRHPERYVNGMKGHSLLSNIGADRAASYEPSSYAGDKGGAAGGYGVGHGMDGGAGHAPVMVSHGYGGAALGFEGGVRAGGVSEMETLPSQGPYPKKTGFDEHRAHGYVAEGSLHGLPGVEGIKTPTQRPGDHGLDAMAKEEAEPGSSDGFACSHGCGSMKSRHGLARHLHAKHGGFGALGHALTSHGSSYAPNHKDSGPSGESKTGGETRGETEGPRGMAAIRSEFEKAKPASSVHSSYDSGDGGGSCGKV